MPHYRESKDDGSSSTRRASWPIPRSGPRRSAVALARPKRASTSLTAEHWAVIEYIREYYLENNLAPMVRKICQTTGFPLKHIYELVPLGPGQGRLQARRPAQARRLRLDAPRLSASFLGAAISPTASMAVSMCSSVLNGPIPKRTAPWILSVPELLVDEGRAVQAGAAGDVVVDVEHRPDVGRLQPVDVEEQDADVVLEVVLAVERDAGDRLAGRRAASRPEPISCAWMASMPCSSIHFTPGVEAGDAGQVGRAVLQPVGVLLEMESLGRADARSAGPGVADLDALPDVQPADAHRAEQRLVAGEGRRRRGTRPPCRSGSCRRSGRRR